MAQLAVFAVLVAILGSPSTLAYVISCPPNVLVDSPTLKHLCFAIEKAISDNAIPDGAYARMADMDVGPLPERNVNSNVKRQDVDHVFLRFGRRFGL